MAAERQQQLAQDAARFRDPDTGEPMLVAAMYHRRVVADLFYLARARLYGQAAAGRETCARFGHELQGPRCRRCGVVTR